MLIPFRLGIRYRLFLIIFAATCGVILSMFLITRISFERGAYRYVHAVEKEQLQHIGAQLQTLYGATSSWEFLGQESTSWLSIMRSVADREDGESPPQGPDPGESSIRLGHLYNDHGPSLRLALPHPPGPPRHHRDFLRRVLLFDKKNNQLQGEPGPWKAEPYLLPLRINGEQVGTLGLLPPKILSDERMRHFISEQHRSLLFTALCIGLGSALLSLPLAGRMVRRIMSLATATNSLASGVYTTRVPASSGDELGQLARDFNQLAQTLERNEQQRRSWVADISHELRTPLAVLQGEIEAVQDGVRPLNNQTMEVLHAEILHLNRLVEDLYELSLADIGALHYHKRRLDWASLVVQQVESARQLFAEHNLALSYTGPQAEVWIFGDGERLRQLIANILQNTLRYTDSGGQLDVTMREERERGEGILIFADSAPGVPTSGLPYLFDRLYRVEGSRNRARGGAGLGLALCKSIVEAHGGQIEASHSELGGLQIRLVLSLAHPEN